MTTMTPLSTTSNIISGNGGDSQDWGPIELRDSCETRGLNAVLLTDNESQA